MPTAVTAGAMTISFEGLQQRIGRAFFGKRTVTDEDDLEDINECIQDGLQTVYTAHRWSFLRPVVPITTTAPYETGTITVVDGVVTLAGTGAVWPSWAATGDLTIAGVTYSVDTRDSDSQITLDDTSVDAAAGTEYSLTLSLYDLPDGFDAIEGNELTFAADSGYPSIKIVTDLEIRRRRAAYAYSGPPVVAAVVTVQFDPTVGSVRQIEFYPSPDASYELSGIMRLRPTMLDAYNQYPIGAEALAPLFVEACLAAAERNLSDGQNPIHAAQFQTLLAAAIQADKEAAAPGELGDDEGGELRSPSSGFLPFGDLTFDGEVI